MRDIRKDLSERLDELKEEREQLQRRLQVISEQENSVRQLLAEEGKRWGDSKNLSPITQTFISRGTQLQKFLLVLLSDGVDWPLESISEQARLQGLVPSNGPVGRTLHGGLIGLKKLGLVDMPETSVWRIAKRET